ncbi:hypothetical protein AB0K11_24605 [Mycobacterium sp. NPDC050551]|uniref:hypothetical protein n=1 Tax=Mycobacterium sp. NPDC050551 TaxID=3155407 RepID=UPI0034189F75
MDLDDLSDVRAHAQALADLVAEAARVPFREMNDFLHLRGVEVHQGEEELLGEHLRQPHIGPGTTLLGPTSSEYVAVVATLFAAYPVTLVIGDMACFRGAEEPWWVTWTGSRGVCEHGTAAQQCPPVNPDAHDIADRAKHAYAVGTELLAEAQDRLAELAGTGRLDAEASMSLQTSLVLIWEQLYSGTQCAVRDESTPDWTWDETANTYSDGRQVVTQVRVEPRESSDDSWEHNRFMVGDGAPNEFRRGTVSYIAPRLPEDAPQDDEGAADAAGLMERLRRYEGE